AVLPVGSVGSAAIQSLSLKIRLPARAEVCTTKWVDQVLPPSAERLTPIALAASERLKAMSAYQNVPLGPAATAGSPAASYRPGAAGSARTSPGMIPADRVAPPSADR